MISSTDLRIGGIDYKDNQGWQILTISNQRHPAEQAEVNFFFQDGTIRRAVWNLSEKKKEWFFRDNQSLLEVVKISAPEGLDWRMSNNIYFNQLWSKGKKVNTFSSREEFTSVAGEKSYYLVYTVHSPENDTYKLILEERDYRGKLRTGPLTVFSGRGYVEFRPQLKLLNCGNEDYLLLGWNEQSGGHRFYRLSLSENNGGIRLTGLTPGLQEKKTDTEEAIKVKLLDIAGNNQLFVLTSTTLEEELLLQICTYSGLNITGHLKIPVQKIEIKQIMYGKVLPDREGLNIICLGRGELNYQLLFVKTDYQGRIITPVKQISQISNIDLGIPQVLQVISAGELRGFHLAWIEKTRGMKINQQLNYLVVDRYGKVDKQFSPFKNISGYLPGFSLLNSPGGSIELFLSRDFGHQIKHSPQNTEIIKYKYSPDFGIDFPVQQVVSTAAYDSYPLVNYGVNGRPNLLWLKDRQNNFELFYATIKPTSQGAGADKSFKGLIDMLLNRTILAVIEILFALLYSGILSLIPLIVLLLYNSLGRYKKNSFLYWLTAISLMFLLKVLFESFYLTWNNPLLVKVYGINVVFLMIITAICTLYWRLADHHDRQNNSLVFNRFLIIWFVSDYIITYLIYLKDYIFA